MSELVVLLDEAGRSVGTAAKASVHHADTPLHLAFSCYVLSDAGELLVTRRALGKHTWPGVWTNSLCGHPAPGEAVADAVVRRARDELGLELTDLRLVLPAFRYRAVMPDGVVENEMCPVFTARPVTTVRPVAEEVDSVEWVPWDTFRAGVLSGERDVSPWCVTQVRELPADLVAARAVAPDALPAAAR